MKSVEDVVNFWFIESTPSDWFAKSEKFDRMIYDRFFKTYCAAKEGKLSDWKTSLQGCLALVIILDQFSRNMFRNQAEAFSTDQQALAVTQYALSNYHWEQLPIMQQVFLCMPLMHSEDIIIQTQSIEIFNQIGRQKNIDYAKQHFEIIKRFGRFPFRNEALNRTSTDEEKAYMATHDNF